MHNRPRTLIVTTAGINCDRELAHAFELAGASSEFVHLNRLMAAPDLLDQYDLIGLPGGFSYGDAVAAGRIGAQLLRQKLYPAFMAAIERGVPIIAPCNGFQMAVQMGLLPGPPAGVPWPHEPAVASVALTRNDTGRFTDRSGQIAVRYAAADNPNGSDGDIAGICDASGLVLGLMPHPERYTRWSHHPSWTRLDEASRAGDPPGLAMFRNAVAHVHATATV
ncbi:MAG: phosphoribosylformylglycinamidine synthase subunit PurQ [Planctomycetota bacterium]|jgi:phosphoribosylformylglycinamidine synthase